MVSNTLAFFRHLSNDIDILWREDEHPEFRSKESAIFSVALRALGALVMIIAAAVFLSSIGLALTGSIGSGVFRVIGAIALGIIAQDMIQIGQNMEPLDRHGILEIIDARHDSSATRNTVIAHLWFNSKKRSVRAFATACST